jgi:type I restriction enzyme S subunit
MGHVKDLKTGIKYKNTPIGKIPVDWEVTSIEKICNIKRGASPRPIGDPSFFSATGRGWIRISDVTTTYKYLRRTSQYLSEKGVSRSVKVEPGDLIMSICATIGKPILLGIEACIHDGFVLFSGLTQKVDSEFLFYLLQKVENKFTTKGQVGTQGNLNTGIVKKTILALPPIAEQKKIAEILTIVDAAIEKTDQIIEKTKEVKKGLMQKLLTCGIGHKKFKKTEIGEIPEEWEVIRLKDIIQNFYNGGTPDTKNKDYWDGNIPWITGADFEDQKIKQFRRYITDEGVKNSATNVVPKGNLLVVTRTGVGKLAIAPFDIAISQDITGVILNLEKVLPQYIYWYLGYKSTRLRSIIQGTSINGLLREDLEIFPIVLPKIDEQKQIAEILSSIDEEIEKESNHKEQLELLKKGLMQVLLTGKIRVS